MIRMTIKHRNHGLKILVSLREPNVEQGVKATISYHERHERRVKETVELIPTWRFFYPIADMERSPVVMQYDHRILQCVYKVLPLSQQ